MLSSTGWTQQLFDCRLASINQNYKTSGHGPCLPTMNDFLTNFSSDHTLLWGLLIIGVVAASAVGLHLFWTAVLRSLAALRGRPAKNPEDGG